MLSVRQVCAILSGSVLVIGKHSSRVWAPSYDVMMLLGMPAIPDPSFNDLYRISYEDSLLLELNLWRWRSGFRFRDSKRQNLRFDSLDVHAGLPQVRTRARLLVVGITLAVKRVISGSFVQSFQFRKRLTSQLRSTSWIASIRPNIPNANLITEWSQKAPLRSRSKNLSVKKLLNKRPKPTLMDRVRDTFNPVLECG
jgi:hypothetical protein